MAGRLAAGEMGNGVLLEEMKPAEQKLRDEMYQVATFHAGNKPLEVHWKFYQGPRI